MAYEYLNKGECPFTKEYFTKVCSETKNMKEAAKVLGIGINKFKVFKHMLGVSQGKKQDIELTDFQKDVLYGSCLGDGRIGVGGKNTCFFTETHGEKQKDYLQWKKDVLHTIVSMPELREDYRRPARNSIVEVDSLSYTFSTQTNKYLYELRNEFYDDGGKPILPNSFAERLNDVIFAVWFMDDGSLRKDKIYHLYTSGYSNKEVYYISSIFKQKLKLENVVASQYDKLKEKYYYYIRFRVSTNDIFYSLVSPYIHECMKYKLLVY